MSHGYSGHLWVPCHVLKTKVDSRAVGDFWRIAAGEEAFTGIPQRPGQACPGVTLA